MENERELISLCRSKIEQTLNWGDSSQWTNSDFELLSEKIFEKTQVRLSISTLKRIWGKVKYDNSPTSATLNALASYIGYASWRDFESTFALRTTTDKSDSSPSESNPIASTEKSDEQKPQYLHTSTLETPFIRSKRFKLFSAISLGVICVAVIAVLAKGRSDSRFDPTLAKFEHRRVVANDLPNSVVFNYDASAYDADSVFIQQNWDRTRRERVAPKGKQHTSVYYLPGHFLAKLVINDQVVKEDTVFIETNGWRAMIEEEKVPIYLAEDDFKKGEKMVVSSALLREKIGTTIFNGIGATLTNVRRFNVSGNAFDFESSLRCTSPAEESACRRIQILLLTTTAAIIIPLSTKGCISEIGLMGTDGFKSGKNTDLSKFGCDYLKPEKIRCSVRDKVFNVWLNEELIYTENQTQEVGDIVGIRIHFEGAAELEYAILNGEKI